MGEIMLVEVVVREVHLLILMVGERVVVDLEDLVLDRPVQNILVGTALPNVVLVVEEDTMEEGQEHKVLLTFVQVGAVHLILRIV